MSILPFGQAVYLWRRHRGLTQAALATRSGVARPNLSAIEQGRREVSLTTLRALAWALQVRPGVLVDGQPPEMMAAPGPLGREALERVAEAATGGRQPAAAGERRVAVALAQLTRNRCQAARGRRGGPRRGARAAAAAWLALEAAYAPQVIESLLARVQNRLGR